MESVSGPECTNNVPVFPLSASIFRIDWRPSVCKSPSIIRSCDSIVPLFPLPCGNSFPCPLRKPVIAAHSHTIMNPGHPHYRSVRQTKLDKHKKGAKVIKILLKFPGCRDTLPRTLVCFHLDGHRCRNSLLCFTQTFSHYLWAKNI